MVLALPDHVTRSFDNQSTTHTHTRCCEKDHTRRDTFTSLSILFPCVPVCPLIAGSTHTQNTCATLFINWPSDQHKKNTRAMIHTQKNPPRYKIPVCLQRATCASKDLTCTFPPMSTYAHTFGRSLATRPVHHLPRRLQQLLPPLLRLPPLVPPLL